MMSKGQKKRPNDDEADKKMSFYMHAVILLGWKLQKKVMGEEMEDLSHELVFRLVTEIWMPRHYFSCSRTRSTTLADGRRQTPHSLR
jgi:hypothetical protein